MLTAKPIRELINATSETLSKPLSDISISKEVPAEITQALQENVFYFSGFKTHHEMVEASQLMKGDDGAFKPFEQFKRDVQSIDNTYNRNYLKAEYNFAVQSTQMAVKWKEWEKDGDDYDLQYRTAGDERVREEHAALDMTTLPPSDPFWNEYLPPLGWNCRCTTVQVRKDKYPRSNSDESIARGQAATAKPKQQIFRFNPGKQQKIFPPKHPYYKTNEDVKKYLNEDVERRKLNFKEYEQLKKDNNYNTVCFDEASGGVKAEHKGHVVHDENEERFFKGLTKDHKGLTSTQLERCCQNNLFLSGHKAVLRNEKIYDPNGKQLPALDLQLDNKIMDIASITTAEKYGNILMSKNRQLGNVKKKTGIESDSVCLYFHNPEMYSDQQLMNDINWYRKRLVEVGSHQRINHIYVVINKERELFIFDL